MKMKEREEKITTNEMKEMKKKYPFAKKDKTTEDKIVLLVWLTIAIYSMTDKLNWTLQINVGF